jgi:hypothetical protein
VSPTRPRSSLRWLALALAVGFFVWTAGATLLRLEGLPPAAAVDLLPLWLGPQALVRGRDPTDAVVLEDVFHTLQVRVQVSAFLSYHPPTASVLFLPTTLGSFPTVAYVFRYFAVAALVGAGAATATAGRVRDRIGALAAAIVIAGVFLSTSAARGALIAGQAGPLLVGATALGLWALARGRDTLAGTATAVGVGLKLFPLVLLPAAVRNRRFGAAFVVTLLALCLGVAVFSPPFHPLAWFTALTGFVNQRVSPQWQRAEPPFLLRLWQGRFLALGAPSLAAAVWAARAPPRAALSAATAALFVAWGGTVMAGSQHYHEALLLLPAVGWVLGWPAVVGPTALSWALADRWRPAYCPITGRTISKPWVVRGQLPVHTPVATQPTFAASFGSGAKLASVSPSAPSSTMSVPVAPHALAAASAASIAPTAASTSTNAGASPTTGAAAPGRGSATGSGAATTSAGAPPNTSVTLVCRSFQMAQTSSALQSTRRTRRVRGGRIIAGRAYPTGRARSRRESGPRRGPVGRAGATCASGGVVDRFHAGKLGPLTVVSFGESRVPARRHLVQTRVLPFAPLTDRRARSGARQIHRRDEAPAYAWRGHLAELPWAR